MEQKKVQEGSVQLSTQMLTAIPEVDLGIEWVVVAKEQKDNDDADTSTSVRLQNIEDTERAKRKYLNERKEGEVRQKIEQFIRSKESYVDILGIKGSDRRRRT